MYDISVVMPVYNGEDHLRESIDSILAQTFENFEFLIVCEYGSNEESVAILEEYAAKDPRVKILYNKERLGIAASLNVGMKAAQGEYIARMDGDDISMPRRFEVQKLYMDMYPDIGMCGTTHRVIDSPNWLVDYSSDPDHNNSDLTFMSTFRHPTVMFRRSAVEEYDLYYDESLPGVEDYELYLRASKYIKMTNIQEPELFYHRRGEQNASLVHRERDDLIQWKLMDDNFKDRFGLEFDPEDIKRLSVVTFLNDCSEKDVAKELKRLDELLVLIEETNREKGVFPEESMLFSLQHRWMRARYKMKMALHNKIPGYLLDEWRKGTYYEKWMN